MIKRFEGDRGRQKQIEVLVERCTLVPNETVAGLLADAGETMQYEPDDHLMVQGEGGNDVFFVLVGEVVVLQDGRELCRRDVGHVVGEFAAVDSTGNRSATVRALTRVVALRVDGDAFLDIADLHQEVWRRLTKSLIRKIRQRKAPAPQPNATLQVFIGSAKESLHVAEALRDHLAADGVEVHLWSEDVFVPGSGTLDDLLNEARTADFAVLVAGADDHTTSRGATVPAPRDNVVFEFGMFLGAIGPQRTLIMNDVSTKPKLPTDYSGRNWIEYDGRAATENPRVATEKAATKIKEVMARHGAR